MICVFLSVANYSRSTGSYVWPIYINLVQVLENLNGYYPEAGVKSMKHDQKANMWLSHGSVAFTC